MKITRSYYYPPIRMAKIKQWASPNAGEDAEKLDHSYITGWNIK